MFNRGFRNHAKGNAMSSYEERLKEDKVNRPSHYVQGGIECFDVLKAFLTPEEMRGHCIATITAYLLRSRNKGGDEDLRKAKWYMDKLVEMIK